MGGIRAKSWCTIQIIETYTPQWVKSSCEWRWYLLESPWSTGRFIGLSIKSINVCFIISRCTITPFFALRHVVLYRNSKWLFTLPFIKHNRNNIALMEIQVCQVLIVTVLLMKTNKRKLKYILIKYFKNRNKYVVRIIPIYHQLVYLNNKINHQILWTQFNPYNNWKVVKLL